MLLTLAHIDAKKIVYENNSSIWPEEIPPPEVQLEQSVRDSYSLGMSIPEPEFTTWVNGPEFTGNTLQPDQANLRVVSQFGAGATWRYASVVTPDGSTVPYVVIETPDPQERP